MSEDPSTGPDPEDAAEPADAPPPAPEPDTIIDLSREHPSAAAVIQVRRRWLFVLRPREGRGSGRRGRFATPLQRAASQLAVAAAALYPYLDLVGGDCVGA
jgi:hypothetical protein